MREFYRQEAESRKYLPEYQGYDERQLGKMTHLEIMDYHPDTWEPGDYRVLFDYRKRDVLTYEAHSQKIDEKGYASV